MLPKLYLLVRYIIVAGQFIYFLRFQLTAWIFLIAFPILSIYSPTFSTLFAGLFDLSERSTGDIVSWSYVYIILFTLLTLMLSWTALITTKVNLCYGVERFSLGIDAEHFLDKIRKHKNYHRILFAMAVLSSIPLLFIYLLQLYTQFPEKLYIAIICMAGSMIAFVVSLFAVDFVQRLLNFPKDAEKLDDFLFPFPSILFKKANKNDKWVNRVSDFFIFILTKFGVFEFGNNIIKNVPRWFGEGFIRYEHMDEKTSRVELSAQKPMIDDQKSVFNPEHLLGLTFLSFFSILYLIIGWFGWNGWGKHYFPALLYVLLYAIVLVWFWCGVAFFFDRFRLPSIIFTIIVFSLLNLSGSLVLTRIYDADIAHLYKVYSDKTFTLKKPSEILADTPSKKIEKRQKPFAILVAADGGGIQAAAWTAKVLVELEKKCKQIYADRGESYQGECSKNIRLISSVSGGSIGAMYFLNAYTQEGLPVAELQDVIDEPECTATTESKIVPKCRVAPESRVVREAETSSLDSVSWGLVYPDNFRILGIPSKFSRGVALEENWESIQEKSETDKVKPDKPTDKNLLKYQTLKDWRDEDWRPAFIFNATVVETGERLMISSSGFNSEFPDGKKPQGRITFQELMNECKSTSNESKNEGCDKKSYNIKIATAARLSASFPYVTPTAHATDDSFKLNNNYGLHKHIADGGYFDNYGISSLSEWLNEALTDNKALADTELPIKNILVIQIRSSNVSQVKLTRPASEMFLQTYSPAITLLNIRTSGQLSHAESEFQLLMDKWNGKTKTECEQNKDCLIKSVVFEYQPEKPINERSTFDWLFNGAEKDTPLSWHLTNKEKNDIHTAWDFNTKQNPDMKRFEAFVNGVIIDGNQTQNTQTQPQN